MIVIQLATTTPDAPCGLCGNLPAGDADGPLHGWLRGRTYPPPGPGLFLDSGEPVCRACGDGEARALLHLVDAHHTGTVYLNANPGFNTGGRR